MEKEALVIYPAGLTPLDVAGVKVPKVGISPSFIMKQILMVHTDLLKIRMFNYFLADKKNMSLKNNMLALQP